MARTAEEHMIAVRAYASALNERIDEATADGFRIELRDECSGWIEGRIDEVRVRSELRNKIGKAEEARETVQ